MDLLHFTIGITVYVALLSVCLYCTFKKSRAGAVVQTASLVAMLMFTWYMMPAATDGLYTVFVASTAVCWLVFIYQLVQMMRRRAV